MRIWRRFCEYPYKYGDHSFFECLIYTPVWMLIGLVALVGAGILLVTVPVWAIPYLVYKNKKLKEKELLHTK